MATKSNKPIDITEVGPLSYRQLQEANHQNLTGLSSEYQLMSLGIQLKYAPTSLYDARANAELLVQSSMALAPTAWGESSFDEDYATEEQFQHLGDIRAENQPWYSLIANGIAKGALLAGTTFLDGTLGLLVGTGTAINEGRWSGLWDNDFSKAMQAVNEWSEEAIPNYYTEAEQNLPWYENIFTANFLGDKFIKNLGFTVGAFYSGGLEAGALRGAGKLAMGTAKKLGASIDTIKKVSKASSHVASTVGALTSAVNEGRIEALNNSKDWYETLKMLLDDTYQQRLAAIQLEYEATKGHLSGTMETGFVDPAYEKYQASLAREQANYEATLGKLNEDRLKMGNADLLMNIPILTASNLIQFGKMYANGFRTGKRANNIVGNITDGYKGATTRAAGIRKAIMNPLSEGAEEITQGMASRISGNYYADDADVTNYYKAKNDPDAQEKTLSWWKSFALGINETVNDGSAWEEFFIGTLTGAMGMPRFRGVRNELGKFQSPITLEGGILGELRENRELIAREQEITDYMNNRLNSPEFRNYYQGLSRHNYYQAAMDLAIQDDDEFAFKNAELAQFISDVSMFDAAGKIEDLTTLINSAYDTSDENLESIARNTTSVVTAELQALEINDAIQELELIGLDAEQEGDTETLNQVNALVLMLNDKLSRLRDTHIGPFVDQDGNPLYATELGKADMINKLTKTKDEMLSLIDDYVKTKIDLQDRLPESVSNDQLDELIFLQTQVNNWEKRGEEMVPLVKDVLGQIVSSLKAYSFFPQQGELKLQDAAKKKAEQLEELLQHEPKELVQILTNPKNRDYVIGLAHDLNTYGPGIIKSLDKENVVNTVLDLARIGLSKDLYQKRLEKYISNPGILAQELALATELQEVTRAATEAITLVDRINNSSTSEIVQAIEEGEIDFDAFDDFLGEEEAANDTRDKILQARDIIDTTDRAREGLLDLVSLGLVTEQAARDAVDLLNNSKSVAESKEELLDLDTEAFNDHHSLNDADARETVALVAERDGMTLDEANQVYNDIMNQRIDEAKNALVKVRTFIHERDAELSDIPSGTTQLQPITETVLTGHDPVDKNEPVNAPSTQLITNKDIANDILNKSGLPANSNNNLSTIISRILNYSDLLVKKGITDQNLILNTIKNLDSYMRLVNAVSGAGNRNIIGNLNKAIADKLTGTKPTTPQLTQPIQVDTTPVITPESVNTDINAENKRDVNNITTEAALETTQKEGTSMSVGRVNGTYNYWRPTTTELPIHRERGNDTPYWLTVNSPARERYQAIYEYLKNNGAFSRVNNNQVKKGDEVHFGISKELSEKVGKPIILLLNSNNEVIGDLPMPEDASFNSYVGLPLLYEGASNWYKENHESLHSGGNDIAVIPGYKSNVARNMVGKPQYTALDDRHTLNQISTVTTSDGSQKQVPFRLGIAIANADSDRIRIMSDAGRSKAQGASPLERTIIAPLRAVKGQPFLLMPTSSSTRAFMPVPIMMPRFDLGNPTIANSSLGLEISKKVLELATIPNNTDLIIKWINSIQELLSIPEIHVNFSNPKFTTEGRVPQELIVSIRRPGETKLTTIFKGPQELAADAVLNGLSGLMFQVSRKYINDTYNGRSYNEMIGELAETNLPIGATHTINDWFTIDPIVDRKQQKAHSPKSTRVNPTQTQGTVIRFQDSSGNSYYMTNSNRLYKENPDGHDTELLGDSYNHYKAHAYGARINETFTRPYDTPWGYYNPLTGKFEVKPSQATGDAQKLAERLLELDELDLEARQLALQGSEAIRLANEAELKAMTDEELIHAIESLMATATSHKEAGRNALAIEMEKKANVYLNELISRNLLGADTVSASSSTLTAQLSTATEKPVTTDKGTKPQVTEKDIILRGLSLIGRTLEASLGAYNSRREIKAQEGKSLEETILNIIKRDVESIEKTKLELDELEEEYKGRKDKDEVTAFSLSHLSTAVNSLRNAIGLYYSLKLGFKREKINAEKLKEGDLVHIDSRGIYANVDIAEIKKIDGDSVSMILNGRNTTIKLSKLKNLTLVKITKPLEQLNTVTDKQVTRLDSIDSLKNMGLLNKKERNAALDKLSDDRLAKVAGMPKLRARLILERFDTKIKANMDSDAINNAFDSVAVSKPLNREVIELMDKEKSWSKESEIKKMSKVLPQLSEDGRVRVINGLIRIVESKDPAYAWGQFQDGIITLSDRAARGTMYHESFHFVTLTLLSQKELNDLYNSAEKQYGKLERLELEENLAEDFRRFMLSYEDDGFFKNIFKTLKHIIKSLVGKETITNKLFHDIRRGALASRSINTPSSILYRKDPMTLTQELNNLRQLWKVSHSKKFQDEVEEFNDKVNRNWDAAYNIINKYGLRDVAYVFEGQYGAAKIGVKSLKEFINKADRLKSQILDAYEAELSDDDRLSNYALLLLEEMALYRIAETNLNNSARDMRREALRFLDNFGITIRDIDEFGTQLELFNALDRTINISNADDISEGTGYAIAFMMQHHPMMKLLIQYRMNSIPKSVRRSIRNRGDFTGSAKIGDLSSEVKQLYLREIGSDIATELRKLYKVEPIKAEPKSFLSKLWLVIAEFFNMLTPEARTKFDIIKNYTRNIANSVKLNDASIILSTDYKPGTTEKAARVDIGKALEENPYERDIIEYFNSKGIALAGSASIALEGTLYRPSENPLHDVDFNAVGFSKKLLDSVILEKFPNNTFIREIVDGEDKKTLTYLVLDRPFKSRRPLSGIAITELYDESTGETLGSWIGSELTLKEGIKGKFLDFFIGEKNRPYPNNVHNINGKSYLIANYKNAFNAKITWARPKDIWDYNRFVPSNYKPILSQDRKSLIHGARIIWGHPAIGKTTYLEKHLDILEWDQEVNPKRNEFIRNQIDPKHELDIKSKEYKRLRGAYMNEWREHPEYIEFLTNEWNKLKQRAIRENKRLFASPAPLLEIAADDFDLFVNLPEKVFMERNLQRGGTPLGSLGWKLIVNDLLTRVDQNKIVTTELYFSDFMDDNYGSEEQYRREIKQYHREKLDYGRLNLELRDYIAERGLTLEEYNSMTPLEKEVLFRCMY